MEIWMIVVVTLLFLAALLCAAMPVAFALALSGATGLLMLHGSGYTTNMLGSLPFTSTSSYTLTIVPLFILMGMFAVKAGVAEQVFTIANRLFRNVRGGLGVATVMTCAGFAAVSGSSIGTAATMSKLAVGEMRRYGYPAALASGIVSMAGTLGILIPPSVILVMYAILTGESVGAVLAAGIVPGIISAVAYALFILVIGQRQVVGGTAADAPAPPRPGRAVDGGATAAGAAPVAVILEPLRPSSGAGASARLEADRLPWRGLIRIAILFGVVMGGIYSGLYTPTESAAIGALLAALFLVWEKRGSRSGLWGAVRASLTEASSVTSMTFALVVGSAVLSTFLVAAGVPRAISDAILALQAPPLLVLGLLLLLLVPLGAFIDPYSILIITVPIVYPVAMELGFDGVWLAIVVVKLIEIGLVIPPVGENCFVVSATSGVPLEVVYRGVLPLVLIDGLVILLLFFVPGISLWLPSLVVPG